MSGAFLALVLVLISGLFGAAQTSAAVVTVGGKGGVKTVAGALSKAKPGDVIEIHPGIYSQGFSVKKNVTIDARPGAKFVLGPTQSINIDGVREATFSGLDISAPKGAGKTKGGKTTLLQIRNSRNVKIRGCRINPVSGWALSIRKSSKVVIDQCHLSGPAEGGVFILNADAVLMRRTAASGFKFGLVVNSGKDVALVNNLLDSNNNAITVSDGQADIIGNTINGPGAAGIRTEKGTVSVAGNAVRRYRFGIIARAGARGELVGNVLSQNTANGLLVGGPGYHVSRNRIAYNDGNGILVRPSGKAGPKEPRSEIVNNIISSNTGAGVHIADGLKVLVRENLLENNAVGLRAFKSNVEVEHNTVVLNTAYAMVFAQASNVSLRRNIIANNNQGIWAFEGVTLKSQNNVVYGHIHSAGFQVVDVNYISQAWMPTQSGDEFEVKIIPDRQMRAATDLNEDPGFVKLGADYRLRPNSAIIKHFTKGNPPGAFPVAGNNE